MEAIKNAFAAKLLAIKAIKLQPQEPFTWASGWKSPIYTDNRKTLAYPDVRRFVKQELCHHTRHHQRRVSPATRPERQEYVATEILLWNDATLGVDDAKQHHGTPCAEGVAQA